MSSVLTVEYKAQRFSPPTTIMAFVVVMLAVLYIVFPKNILLEQTAVAQRADELSVVYLQEEWTTAQQVLQSLLQEKINNNLSGQSQWLQYKIQHSRSVALKKHVSFRQALHQWQDDIKQLAHVPVGNDALNALAQDALTLNMPNIAVAVYQRMLNSNEVFDASWYAEAGRVALSTGNYELSAQLYWLAYAGVNKRDDKRKYYIAALSSLQAGNKVEQAIAVAQQKIGDLANDRKTLIFLTRLALAANHPDLAQQYLQKVMGLS